MNLNIKKLVRTNVQTLKPYQSARLLGGKGDIWLNANEFPIPVSFKIFNNAMNRYPECQPKLMLELYASYANLDSDQILTCRGADEAIDLIMRTFCEPNKDSILFCSPTYDMYRVVAETIGIHCYNIPKLENWQLNLSAIINQLDKVKVIYICNPNNPTGNVLNPYDIQYLLKIIDEKVILVIDEAYIEFCAESTSSYLLTKHTNLIIIRTLSKAFALAGIRCGFILANKIIINFLLKVITPYPISTPVIDIATQALSKNNIVSMYNKVKKLIDIRKWFLVNLKKCHCVEKIFSSETNYLLVRFIDSSKIFNILWKRGIVLRDQNNHLGLSGYIRISIGTKKECKYVISILQSLSTD
ncbi:MAG: histidinol-phosphate transaminase [Pantoea sp. Brub]|nr:histidinol-phosphate transaminase [Pantoea sp. Brub]